MADETFSAEETASYVAALATELAGLASRSHLNDLEMVLRIAAEHAQREHAALIANDRSQGFDSLTRRGGSCA